MRKNTEYLPFCVWPVWLNTCPLVPSICSKWQNSPIFVAEKSLQFIRTFFLPYDRHLVCSHILLLWLVYIGMGVQLCLWDSDFILRISPLKWDRRMLCYLIIAYGGTSMLFTLLTVWFISHPQYMRKILFPWPIKLGQDDISLWFRFVFFSYGW